MATAKTIVRDLARKAKSKLQRLWTSHPKRVQCNLCGWEGRHFLSNAWHRNIVCPRCFSDVRHRLFFDAICGIEGLCLDEIIPGKHVLHFAPEEFVGSQLRSRAGTYVTADLLRSDCDFQVDMSNMTGLDDGSCDVVIAFDVLEHVPDYQKALEEVHRVLAPAGFGIFTVPQKDNLQLTYEDPSLVSPEERTTHFGEWNHLRIFGDDFAETIESKGFSVTAVSADQFSQDIQRKHVLLPPKLSSHPLATNYRKVFFCKKVSRN